MSADVVQLSSDDSDDSMGSKYYDKARTETQPMDKELKDSDESTAVSVSGISKSSQSQDNSKKKMRKKRSGTHSERNKNNTAERQAQKKKVEEEKKEAQDAYKIYRPGECMKYMTIEMHPSLLESWYCADIVREASSSGVKVRGSSAIFDPNIVLWTRTVPPALINNQGLLQLAPQTVHCERALYVYRMEDAAELVASRSLSDSMRRVRQLANCKLTLVLYGLKDYFKKSGRKTAKSVAKIISEASLENAITDLLVTADCDTMVVNTPNELALTILHFTKAIAEQPHKQAKRDVDELADFYMRGDNKKCVAVDKDGNGTSRLWQQMLAVLPMASLESSRALCAQYPSPLTMFEALQTPEGVKELADVGVTRAAVPGAKTRRIGPEFARKLEILFTATDGNILID